MSLKVNALIGTLVILATGATAQAQSISQDDISSCRTAITAENPELLDGYRLRFKSVKGHKQRTIKLAAIPNKKSVGERFNITCEFSSKDVVMATRTDKNVRLAKK